MADSFIGSLEERIKYNLKEEEEFAEKCELRVQTLSNRRDIFGKIKNRDEYEENLCWAYWHRAKVNVYQSIMEMVKNSREEYEKLLKKYCEKM